MDSQNLYYFIARTSKSFLLIKISDHPLAFKHYSKLFRVMANCEEAYIRRVL